MTKIAIYIPSLGGGGAERIMQILANEFVEKGCEVDLLLCNNSGPYIHLLHPSVNIVDFRTKRVLKSIFPFTRYLKTQKPDIILSALTHANVAALLAVKLSGVKSRVIISERNSFRIYLSIPEKIVAFFLRFIMRIVYPWSNAITSVSEGVSEELRLLLPKQKKKIITIYNPIITLDHIVLMNEIIDHPWLSDKTIPCVISAGRLELVKDYSTLISAFSKVIKRQEARLIILGEGSERNKLNQKIINLRLEKYVDLSGFVENPLAYFKKADLFVLSSISEGLPGVLIQAMACELPVLATNCFSGPAEILENGKWGRLVPVGDVDAMAEAMYDSLTEKTHPDVKLRAMDFTVSKSVDKYLEVMGLL